MQESDLIEYLKEELENKEKELFLVVTGDVERNQNWLTGTKANYKLNERDSEVLVLKDVVSDKLQINSLSNSVTH